MIEILGDFIINRGEIINLLVKYKPYSVIEGFKDIWLDLSVE